MLFSYSNPVFPDYFADPFVLQHAGGYYAFGTAPRTCPRERAIPVLYSDDLAHWTALGGALELLPECLDVPLFDRRHYWAPEVVERRGTFWMFYSCSAGRCDRDGLCVGSQRLRLATSKRPEGPFRDVGALFARDEFCIDPHPFCDPATGQWYLYFARNLTDRHGLPGTALWVVPLGDDMRPVGPASVVMRASADWHVYHRNAPAFGQMWKAWHTLEGPHIIVRDGRYYCLYSGGSWQGEGYGVGYGVADHPLGPWRDERAHEGASFLRSTADQRGPGHNSVVLGPDKQTSFVVYHAWDADHTARRMCIDPLVWSQDGRPHCDGPTRGTRSLWLGEPQHSILTRQREWDLAA